MYIQLNCKSLTQLFFNETDVVKFFLWNINFSVNENGKEKKMKNMY